MFGESSEYRSNIKQDKINKQKMMSTVLKNYSNGLSPRSSYGQKTGKNEKFLAFQAQMAEDQERAIEESRRPYVRKLDPNDHKYSGSFKIGNHLDEDVSRVEKLAIQKQYRQQLQDDSRLKSTDTGRKPNARITTDLEPTSSYESRESNFSSSFQDARRRDQERLSEVDYYEKQRNQPYNNAAQSKGSRESSSFENSGTFNIGEAKEQTIQKKIAMRQLYLDQLQSDSTQRSTNNNYDDREKDRSYLNTQRSNDSYEKSSPRKIQWAGTLIIGDPALGDSKEMMEKKLRKQAEYRLMLDQQRLSSQEHARQELLNYRGL